MRRRVLSLCCALLAALLGAAGSSAQSVAWEKLLRATPGLTPPEFVKEAVATSQGTLMVSMAATGNLATMRSHFWLLNASTGDSIWQRPGLPQASGEQALRLLPNGNFGFVTEERAATSTSSVAFYMQQLTPSGNVLGRVRFPLANPAYGAEFAVGLLAPPGSGTYLLGAQQFYSTDPRAYVRLLSLTEQGALRWERHYGWSINELFCDVQLDAQGRAVVYARYIPTTGAFRQWLKLLQLNPLTGDSIKGVTLAPQHTLGEPYPNTLNQLLPLPDGGLLLTGAVDSAGGPMGGASVPFAMKVDAQLRPVWTHLQWTTAGLPVPHYLNAVALQDGSVLVLADGQLLNRVELHHLSAATGQLLGAYTYPSTACGSITAGSLAPGTDGRTVYVVGACSARGSGGGGYVARLTLPAAVANVVTTTRPKPVVAAPGVRLFPNPATTQVTLQLAAPLPTAAQLELRDALGRLVRTERLPPGQATRAVPLAGLPAGFYACVLLVEGRPVATQKLAVVR